jgi:Spy/CpxP family protein refolding chaperone
MTFSTTSRRFAVVAAAVVGATVLTAHPASAQGFKWWQSDTFTRELGLTTDQSSKIEAIFQATVPVLRRQKDALDKAEADFNQMIEASDDAQVWRRSASSRPPARIEQVENDDAAAHAARADTRSARQVRDAAAADAESRPLRWPALGFPFFLKQQP